MNAMNGKIATQPTRWTTDIACACARVRLNGHIVVGQCRHRRPKVFEVDANGTISNLDEISERQSLTYTSLARAACLRGQTRRRHLVVRRP